MKLTGIKIEDYFKSIDLVESLLIEFVFKERENEVELVLDVARDYSDYSRTNILDYDKEWIKYVFKYISRYDRKRGTDLMLIENLNDYLLKRDKRNKVIYFLKAKSEGNSCLIEIDFGDFGIAKIEFSELSVSILYGKARKDAPVGSYIDALSGKLIEYYDPFRKGPDQMNITPLEGQ